MKDGGSLGREISGAPIAVGEIDRLFEKRLLVKRNVELEARAAGERRLREQKIAAAGAAADRKVRGTNLEIVQGLRDRAAAIGSLSGGKRGFWRSGASIMWPLNSATLRGGSGLVSGIGSRSPPLLCLLPAAGRRRQADAPA